MTHLRVSQSHQVLNNGCTKLDRQYYFWYCQVQFQHVALYYTFDQYVVISIISQMSQLNLLSVNCFVNRIMQKETFIFNYLSNSVGFSIFGEKKTLITQYTLNDMIFVTIFIQFFLNNLKYLT